MKLHKYRVILNLFMGSDIVLFSICVEPFFYRVVCTGVHGTVGTDQVFSQWTVFDFISSQVTANTL